MRLSCKDSTKRAKIIKDSLQSIAKHLEDENRKWIKGRSYWITQAVATLILGDVKVQKVVKHKGNLQIQSIKILMPDEEPDEGASIGNLVDFVTPSTPGVANFLADAIPELQTYFQKERSQTLAYQNGNNLQIPKQDETV